MKWIKKGEWYDGYFCNGKWEGVGIMNYNNPDI